LSLEAGCRDGCVVTSSGMEFESIRVGSVLPRIRILVLFYCIYLKSLGGVNHLSLHSHLAKFRGLMYRVKYGAVTDRETCMFVYA